MYSIYCETCSTRVTEREYADANDVFMEHVGHSHEVELVNEAYRQHGAVAGD